MVCPAALPRKTAHLELQSDYETSNSSSVALPSGAYRCYGGRDLGRLSFIRRARDLGFTLDQIRTLLDLAEQRDRDCADVDAIAREHLSEVERKIADLSALRRELRELIGSCSSGTVADCRIIEALSPA